MANDIALEKIVQEVKKRSKATWTPRFEGLQQGTIYIYPEYCLEPDGRLRVTGSVYFYPELSVATDVVMPEEPAP
jgi:hypothetical protein